MTENQPSANHEAAQGKAQEPDNDNNRVRDAITAPAPEPDIKTAQNEPVTDDETGAEPLTQAPRPVSPLGSILSLQDFVNTDDGRRLFASTDSLRWFIKSNYRQLTEADAIAMQGRRLLVRRPQFDEAFVKVTSERARALLAG